MLSDQIIYTISSQKRRGILNCISDMEKQVAEYDEVMEMMIEEDYLDPSDKKQFLIEMEHSHLPKLSDKELIKYDRDSKKIYYQCNPEVEEVLETIRQLEI